MSFQHIPDYYRQSCRQNEGKRSGNTKGNVFTWDSSGRVGDLKLPNQGP